MHIINLFFILIIFKRLFLKHNQNLTTRKEAPGGPRDELTAIHNISVCIKTLINNCESLTRNFTGPQSIDLRSSSIKNASKGAYSPMDVDEDSHSKYVLTKFKLIILIK